MYLFQKTLLIAAICFFGLAATAHASIETTLPSLFNPPKSDIQLIDAELDVAPIAFYKFCAEHLEQCHSENSGQKIEMSVQNWAMLYAVNADIDDRIRPNAKKGAFDWSLGTTFGNCNDYAVQKRDALLKAGLPMSALSLAAVKTANGEGHLVLTVRTTTGDYVLDNLRAKILPWNETGYKWISVQSNADPSHWVHILSAPLVAQNNKWREFTRLVGLLENDVRRE